MASHPQISVELVSEAHELCSISLPRIMYRPLTADEPPRTLPRGQ